MKQEPKQVNYYGLSLMKGCMDGMEATAARTLALTGVTGYYITPMFDTGEEGGTFNRLVVDGIFTGTKLEIIVAATDEQELFIDETLHNLNAYLANPQVPAHKKAETLAHLPSCKRCVNTQDILLHELKGRYVWIYVALYLTGRHDCTLRGLQLELPKYSFTEYFPEIYQGNDFFERYIAVFQSLFLETESRVDDVPKLLDYRTTPDENVEELASWLGINNRRRIFSPEQLRHLIRHIELYQGAKGTRHAMEEIVLLLTDIRPQIVEHFQWQDVRYAPAHREMNKQLYGETTNSFCVILDLMHADMKISENNLEQIIESYSVLGSQFRVVYLHPCSRTDTHCYLGVNSMLSTPEVAGLGTGAIGAHLTVG